VEKSEKHIQVWEEFLSIIKENIDEQKYKTWFAPIKPVSLVDSTLTIEVPSAFCMEFIEGTYLNLIKMILKRVIGPDAKLVYTFKPVRKSPSVEVPASTGITPNNKSVSVNTFHSSDAPSAFVFPGLQKIKINPRLNPAYSFENLIQGDCNRMGVAAGQSISMSPGRTPFNPLFLFGGSGLGKTHIAQAIGLDVKEQHPDLVVLYVTGNEFKTQYMDAAGVRNKVTDFLAYYMKIDVLIVDDIQDLVGQGSQAAFFSIFNYLHQNGKQLIFTSDRAPADLQNFEERLLSRFKWGLSVELTKPDYTTRLEMLRSRCFREGVKIDDKVLQYLAGKIKSNFRELEGALISLIAHATLNRQEDSIELVEKITGNLVSDEPQEFTVDRVVDVVCDYFNLSKEMLVATSRKRNIVQARQIAMYLSRNLVANISLSAIGAQLGGKDHATVLYACNTVVDLMSTDRSFKQYVSDIEKILLQAR